ncbi:pyrimidine utilization protein D [Rhodopseudomonas sp. HC1]|uniref:pyrimidine utilization protein D n=1 Tax=Rhodopseudomonas infernalis TaxID=2897386 RepID=UPI001EE804CC|nr:pyrimidine utilization protein D [Rhodopseudomonas infernalis]MCG6204985.1 pyrimidine utilization protein D [Rhodopseudomonas infernalis]
MNATDNAVLTAEIIGRSEPDAPTIVLSAGLGGAGAFWQPQFAALTKQFRVVLYDHRGTGRNPAALPDGYSIGDMADELIAMLRSLQIDRCHFMGHALGGLVGLELALRAPDMLDRLVQVNAWAAPNPHSKRCFDVRRDLLRHVGVEAYVRAQPIFLYPPAWLVQNVDRVAEEEAHGVKHFQGADNIERRIAALLRFDVAARLGEIGHRTLVLATKDDTLVPWTCSQQLAAGLPDAQLVVMPEGGHGVTVTDAAAFNQIVVDFLASSA